MLLTKMDLLNFQYLDKMNNNIGILCYEGEAALRGDPRLQALSLSSHRTGPPPISPTKRKLSGEQGDSDMDDNEHVAKMSRLFAAQLKPHGDYRSSSKDQSRSPMERVVVPGALGVHGNHLYGHAHLPHHHHLASLAAMDQPLALTKSSSMAERSSVATLVAVPHAVGVAERQQNRPSVITCAPANNRNCNLSHCPLSHNGCSSLTNNYRRVHTNTACDPVIEEHFRRSLGKNYKEPEATATATNSVSITGSVDDHFAKALGETWLQIKNKSTPSSSASSPNSSPDSRMINHNHSPSLVS
uniref:Vestigial-like family member 4b n=1 Tax=Hippocampus comes TaxID=109280 RepID=A0A3Q2Z6T4_HIPCM